jgi:hypothetical protein
VAVHWANCIVCGTSHSTTDPMAPCSAACSRTLIARRQTGRSAPDPTPDHSRQGRHQANRRGGGGGGSHRSGGNCLVLAVALAGGATTALGALAYALARLIGLA